jgi:hypothetical protein
MSEERVKEQSKYSKFVKEIIFDRTLYVTLLGLQTDSKKINDPELDEIVSFMLTDFLKVDNDMLDKNEESSYFEKNYDKWISQVESLKKYKVLYQKPIMNSLMVCDVLIPEINLIIEFDGPSHFF